eukprot:1161821-Pelagomonas_calceolata.AAC.11
MAGSLPGSEVAYADLVAADLPTGAFCLAHSHGWHVVLVSVARTHTHIVVLVLYAAKAGCPTGHARPCTPRTHTNANLCTSKQSHAHQCTPAYIEPYRSQTKGEKHPICLPATIEMRHRRHVNLQAAGHILQHASVMKANKSLIRLPSSKVIRLWRRLDTSTAMHTQQNAPLTMGDASSIRLPASTDMRLWGGSGSSGRTPGRGCIQQNRGRKRREQ